jgi:uncharacterized protein (TIGR02246 family)
MEDRTAARAAIDDVLNRYAQCIDADDLDGIAECFTEDAVLTMVAAGKTSVRNGRSEILATFRASFAARSPDSPPRRHVVTNLVLLEHSSDQARARCYVTVLRIVDGEAKTSTTGIYTDRLVRDTGGGWRIIERRGEFDNDQLLSSAFFMELPVHVS